MQFFQREFINIGGRETTVVMINYEASEKIFHLLREPNSH